MGLFNSKSAIKQILLTGPEGAGKTTLLYQMILRKKEWTATPTQGFNYEEISSERFDRAGVWDLGGCQSSNMVSSSIYKSVLFSAVVYVININDQEQINFARKDMHKLLNEDELRHITYLGIILNQRQGSSNNNNKSNKQPIGGGQISNEKKFSKDKLKKKFHEELDTESLNKRIQINMEIFDVVIDKDERTKFFEALLKSLNSENLA